MKTYEFEIVRHGRNDGVLGTIQANSLREAAQAVAGEGWQINLVTGSEEGGYFRAMRYPVGKPIQVGRLIHVYPA